MIQDASNPFPGEPDSIRGTLQALAERVGALKPGQSLTDELFAFAEGVIEATNVDHASRPVQDDAVPGTAGSPAGHAPGTSAPAPRPGPTDASEETLLRLAFEAWEASVTDHKDMMRRVTFGEALDPVAMSQKLGEIDTLHGNWVDLATRRGDSSR